MFDNTKRNKIVESLNIPYIIVLSKVVTNYCT